MKPAEVGDDLGISRNAVYQHITSLKRAGVLEDQRQAALHDDEDVFDQATHLIQRAEARIEELTEQEAQIKAERERLAAYVKRNRDLLPA